MEMNVHENARLVEIWIPAGQKDNPHIQARLKDIYATYKSNHYTVAVFHSGSGDLYQNISNLLAYNKRHNAALSVQQTSSPHMKGIRSVT